MKQAITIKTIAIIALFSFTLCHADEIESENIQFNYQNLGHQKALSTDLLSLDTVYNIPTVTYQYLDSIFTSFYNKVTFKTDIKDSTFKTTSHNELVSIPLLSENKQGFQIELFGNFSDPATQRLSNFSTDQALYHYYSNTEQLNIYNSTLSVGAGISFNTGKNSKVKVIISNNEMPGYGTSNALLGFETSF